MNLKRFLLAVTAVAMLAAVLANTASAAMVSEGQYYVGGSAFTTAKTLKCEKASGTELILSGTVGTTPTKLKAAGVECLSASVNNVGGHGIATGKLKFTGVTVVEPSGCAVSGEAVETESLKATLYKDTGSPENKKAFEKFEPAVAGGNFATVTITGTCAAAGSRIVKGSTFGESVNPTSTPALRQSIVFSTGVETTSASTETLKLAGNPAHLSGTVTNWLSPEEEFEAH